MTIRSGINAQWGMVQESTWGTAVTVTRFLPFISEKVNQNIARIDSKAIVQGRRVIDSSQWAAGDITCAGQIQTEVYGSSMGLLFSNMLGGAAISGSGTYTQTYTPGDLSAKSMTMQFGRPGVAGVVHPFTYAGVKITKWQLGCTAGQFATLGLDVNAKSEVTGIPLASCSYPSPMPQPLTYVQGTVSFLGSTLPVKSVMIDGDNGLNVARRFVGSQSISEQLEAGLRNYTATVTPEFTDLTLYTAYTAGTTGALVLTFTAGSNTLTITCNVRIDPDATPNVSGHGLIEQPLKLKCIGGTDAAAITLVTVNSDAAP